MSEPNRISPTAYATGHMWVRLGLSHPALSTPQGKRLDQAFSLALQPSRLLGRRSSFDTLMRVRHQGIDELLEAAIEAGTVTQVVEIAAGFSGRGWRMCQKYGRRIRYFETDLAPIAEQKLKMLKQAHMLTPQHKVREVDALAEDTANSLAALISELDQQQGLAIITEGLMSYLDPQTAQHLWSRIAEHLSLFPNGLYLSDAYTRKDNRGLAARVFKQILQRFVRGRIHIHFASAPDAEQQMRQAGFRGAKLIAATDLEATAHLSRLRGGDQVYLLQATR